jgi:hypothetical protein
MPEPKSKTIIERHGFKDPELKTAKHDDLVLWARKNVSGIAKQILPPFGTNDSYLEKVWNKTKLQLDEDYTDNLSDLKNNIKIVEVLLEQPINSGKWIIGFVDLVIKLKIPRYKRHVGTGRDSANIYIEVKTKIESFGELLRQVNMYRMYTQEELDFWVIICPDDSHKAILADQKIFYIKPDCI